MFSFRNACICWVLNLSSDSFEQLQSFHFHCSSMIQVLRWWNAANVQHYRLDRQRKHHESTFSVFLNVGSIIAVRGPLLECHSKNIWFRVEQDLTPGSSRNHMQHAAERLSQQLCLLLSSTNTMRDTNTNTLSPTLAANTVFIHFFRSPLLIVKPLAIYNRQKAYDCISWRAIRERCNCKQLRWITTG